MLILFFVLFYFFQRSSDPKLQELYNKYLAREVDSLPDNIQGYRNVSASPRYGFISLGIIGKYFFKQHHIHNIYQFNIMPQPLLLSFIMKKHSPYGRPMDKMLVIKSEFVISHGFNYQTAAPALAVTSPGTKRQIAGL